MAGSVEQQMSANEEALQSLHRGISHCRKCRLSEDRRHAVPGEGPGNADIMFIGEAPGETEDREGRPFRGRSGVYLDSLLASAGLARRAIFITGSVKCRPPGNREPRPDEMETCRVAWLERQIEVIDPRLIVLLGRIALRQVLGEGGRLSDHHGRIMTRDGRAVLVTYHPAAAMRFPNARRAMTEDFRLVCSYFGAGKGDVQ